VADRANNEETKDPFHADDRNFYKLEKWTRDGTKVDRLLFAGNDLEKARELLANVSSTGQDQTDDPAKDAAFGRVSEDRKASGEEAE